MAVMSLSSCRKSIAVLYLAVFALLVSCGTGDMQLAGGGIGGTGITSGTLTGFGSVFVNGIEFDTTGASRNIDDVVTISTGFDDDTVMDTGMVVTIAGTVNPDGVTGSATSITYDEVVTGPVTSAPVEDPDGVHKTFNVFDKSVSVYRNSTVFVNTDYPSLQLNDVVEISGYFDNAGSLVATRLAREGVLGQGTVVEIRGTVSAFDGIDTFSIGALSVIFDGTTVFEDLPGTVTNGQYVEVNGVLQGGASMLASRIEREDSNLGFYTGEISVEGLVTSFLKYRQLPARRCAGRCIERHVQSDGPGRNAGQQPACRGRGYDLRRHDHGRSGRAAQRGGETRGTGDYKGRKR